MPFPKKKYILSAESLGLIIESGCSCQFTTWYVLRTMEALGFWTLKTPLYNSRVGDDEASPTHLTL